jgi:hypothetical protein
VKIEVELHKYDLTMVLIIALITVTPVMYFIHRDTGIRQTLVEQAKNEAYGSGVIEAVNKRLKR